MWTPTVIWLLLGILLCLAELVMPTAFILFVMGMSAFVVAAIAGFTPLPIQVVIWMGLSFILTLASRRLVRRRPALKFDATEAETLTEILPGKAGRVLYEGNSWAASCADHNLAIAPHQKVYVVARRGTTLIVMPEHLLLP